MYIYMNKYIDIMDIMDIMDMSPFLSYFMLLSSDLLYTS